MNWLDIYAFVTVVREKSISKASRILHLSQPTLTARLRKMEQELNVNLLNRNWKGVELTFPGHQFLLYAVKLLDEFKEMQEELNKPTPAPPIENEKLGHVYTSELILYLAHPAPAQKDVSTYLLRPDI
jgi:DNA-binding transcriptional LysR family regulator